MSIEIVAFYEAVWVYEDLLVHRWEYTALKSPNKGETASLDGCLQIFALGSEPNFFPGVERLWYNNYTCAVGAAPAGTKGWALQPLAMHNQATGHHYWCYVSWRN